MKKDIFKVLGTVSMSGLIVLGVAPLAYADTSGQSTTSVSSTASSNQNSSPTVPPALSQSDALAIALKMFTVPKSVGVPQVSLQQQWYNSSGPVYNINWQPVGRNRQPGIFYSATIDANTGEVLSFQGSRNIVHFTNGVSETKAEQTARETLAKFAPDYSGEVTLGDTRTAQTGLGYVFTFVRSVNGVSAPFDNIVIGIDGQGDLSQYNLNWHKAQFPAAKPTLSLASATNIAMKKPPSHLTYQQIPFVGSSQPESYALTYNDGPSGYLSVGLVGESLPWIDANNGQLLQENGSAVKETSLPTNTSIPVNASATSTLPKPLATPLDGTGAKKIAEQVVGQYGKMQFQNSSSQSGSTAGSTEWNVQFQNSQGGNLQISVDSTYGIITNLDEFPNAGLSNPTPDHVLSQASLNAAAASFVKTADPSLSGILSVIPEPQVNSTNQPNTQGYLIMGKVNGVQVRMGTLSLSVSDGLVQNYWLNFDFSSTLPDPAKALSSSQAWQDYLAVNPLRLEYVLPVDATVQNNGQPNYASDALLVYAPNTTGQSGFIDAITGKWISYDAPGTEQASDIKGHYGQAEMAYLISRGILTVKDGKVSPASTVSRIQFISMLEHLDNITYGGPNPGQMFQDVSQTSPYYNSVIQAVLQGWLVPADKLNPDAPVTRGQAAAWIVNWLGWQEIANKTAIFQTPFSDAKQIPASELGDAIIATDYGMIPLQNGKFNANDKMTVADVAVALAHAVVVQSNE